ncbi:MAG: hypothetical protein JW384_01403 [Nitrosomonadaceae bacterium]|nr:hypothetical protein [Nitrosomonadaceae bacterium]
MNTYGIFDPDSFDEDEMNEEYRALYDDVGDDDDFLAALEMLMADMADGEDSGPSADDVDEDDPLGRGPRGGGPTFDIEKLISRMSGGDSIPSGASGSPNPEDLLRNFSPEERAAYNAKWQGTGSTRRAPAFSNAEIRAMRQESIDRSNRSEARSEARYAISEPRSAAAAARSQARFDMSVEDRNTRNARQAAAPFTKQPKALPTPKEVAAVKPTWAQFVSMSEPSDIANLVNAWTNGGSGIPAIGQQKWRYFLQLFPGAISVPSLERMLYVSWAKSGGKNMTSSRSSSGGSPSMRASAPPRTLRISPNINTPGMRALSLDLQPLASPSEEFDGF